MPRILSLRQSVQAHLGGGSGLGRTRPSASTAVHLSSNANTDVNRAMLSPRAEHATRVPDQHSSMNGDGNESDSTELQAQKPSPLARLSTQPQVRTFEASARRSGQSCRFSCGNPILTTDLAV
jgi:hypothetical protein